MAEQLGSMIGWLVTPLFVLALIALIQFFRTGDLQQARQAATQRWALLTAILFFILTLVARFTQNFQ